MSFISEFEKWDYSKMNFWGRDETRPFFHIMYTPCICVI